MSVQPKVPYVSLYFSFVYFIILLFANISSFSPLFLTRLRSYLAQNIASIVHGPPKPANRK